MLVMAEVRYMENSRYMRHLQALLWDRLHSVGPYGHYLGAAFLACCASACKSILLCKLLGTIKSIRISNLIFMPASEEKQLAEFCCMARLGSLLTVTVLQLSRPPLNLGQLQDTA